MLRGAAPRKMLLMAMVVVGMAYVDAYPYTCTYTNGALSCTGT